MGSFTEIWSRFHRSSAPPPFLLVDCAGIPGGERQLSRHCFSDLECLFSGQLAEELADVAPYLGRLSSVEGETTAYAEELMRRRLAVLVLPSPAIQAGSFREMHRHFRKFNVVYGPEGRPLFFRYYDPRLLFQVLSVLDPAQLEAFFGPVERFVVSDGEHAHECWRQDGRLVVDEG